LKPSIDVYVISWSGQHARAASIAEALTGQVDRVTIIHSDEHEFKPTDDLRWIVVPNDWFYGRKFRQAIADFRGDVMLHITADVTCLDWKHLINRCELAFERLPGLGAWSPSIDYSYWTIAKNIIANLSIPSMHAVTRTDSIVWAMSRGVVDRMKLFDYEANNLGWGIDRAATVYCHTSNRLVIVDSSVAVTHPTGTGYSMSDAAAQSEVFLEQLTLQEKLQLIMLRRHDRRAPGQ
jgi:hypothetical protein